ncbi:MAG: hypothetical protein HY929_00595 [Euryarchaeota archaeon]|nr:hypothetical protein [Euryarchaeota archaeon]
MEKQNLEKMVEILYSGGRMLAHHCKECRSPLFEYQGEIICPSCRKKVTIEEKPKPEVAPSPKIPAPEKVDLELLESVLSEKLRELANQLKIERESEAIAEILKNMDLLLQVLRRVQEFK